MNKTVGLLFLPFGFPLVISNYKFVKLKTISTIITDWLIFYQYVDMVTRFFSFIQTASLR